MVCKEWHSFMNFHAWWQSLELEKNGIDERELKKRVLSRALVQFDVKEGEKIYSPETCRLVSRHLAGLCRNLFSKGAFKSNKSNKYYKKDEQFYTGVVREQYISDISKTYIGTRFEKEEDAAAAVMMYKSRYLNKMTKGYVFINKQNISQSSMFLIIISNVSSICWKSTALKSHMIWRM